MKLQLIYYSLELFQKALKKWLFLSSAFSKSRDKAEFKLKYTFN